MHFWIDKRNQCAYTGRHRMPTSLSAGRSRSRSLGRKGVTAPVHRFTAVATVDCPPRRPRRPSHVHYPRASTAQPQVRRQDNTLYVDMPSPPTIASLAAARSVTPDTLLRTAALGLQHSPMMESHLKFGMLVSFALATVFLAGAKYYFDRQVVRTGMTGGEASVLCVVMAGAAGVGCALTACRPRRTPPPAPPERVSSTARRHRQLQSPPPAPPAPPTPPSPESPPTVSIPDTPQTPSPGSPPPYHIAVLLPPRETASPPPPAYSALS